MVNWRFGVGRAGRCLTGSGHRILCSPIRAPRAPRSVLRVVCFFLFLPFFIVLSACGEEDDGYAPTISSARDAGTHEYVFGVHPLHNPQQLFRVYGPLIDHLNAHLNGPKLRLEASFDYAGFEQKLYSGKFDFALPNPYQTVRSLEHGYRVFAKMGDDDHFRGIIIVRRDSGIQSVADLRGKVISYPAPTALAAAMLPQAFLQEQGLDVMQDTKSIYVGSQESSIMNVVLGTSAAGATWPPIWQRFKDEKPDLAAQLELKWETSSLVNNGLVVREDVPADLTRRIRDLLCSLNQSKEGQTILSGIALSRFEAADDQTYAPVEAFLDHFSKTVRAPELAQSGG
jgi:phosphonate transport system substrate-binding protein